MSVPFENTIKRLYMSGNLDSDASRRVLERKCSILSIAETVAKDIECDIVKRFGQYKATIIDFLDDNVISEEEKEELEEIRELLNITEEEASQIMKLAYKETDTIKNESLIENLQKYRDCVIDFLEDGVISALEREELDEVRDLLGLSEEQINPIEREEIEKITVIDSIANTEVIEPEMGPKAVIDSPSRTLQKTPTFNNTDSIFSIDTLAFNDRFIVYLRDNKSSLLATVREHISQIDSLENAVETSCEYVIKELARYMSDAISCTYDYFDIRIAQEDIVGAFSLDFPTKLMHTVEKTLDALHVAIASLKLSREDSAMVKEHFRQVRNEYTRGVSRLNLSNQQFFTRMGMEFTVELFTALVSRLRGVMSGFINDKAKNTILLEASENIATLVDKEIDRVNYYLIQEISKSGIIIDNFSQYDARLKSVCLAIEASLKSGTPCTSDEVRVHLSRCLYGNSFGVTILFKCCLASNDWRNELERSDIFFSNPNDKILKLNKRNEILIELLSIQLCLDLKLPNLTTDEFVEKYKSIQSLIDDAELIWNKFWLSPVYEMFGSEELITPDEMKSIASKLDAWDSDDFSEIIEDIGFDRVENLVSNAVSSIEFVEFKIAGKDFFSLMNFTDPSDISKVISKILSKKLKSGSPQQLKHLLHRTMEFLGSLKEPVWDNIDIDTAESINYVVANVAELNDENFSNILFVFSSIYHPQMLTAVFSRAFELLIDERQNQHVFPSYNSELCSYFLKVDGVELVWTEKASKFLVNKMTNEGFELSSYLRLKTDILDEHEGGGLDAAVSELLFHSAIMSSSDLDEIKEKLTEIKISIDYDPCGNIPDDLPNLVRVVMLNLARLDGLPGEVDNIDSDSLNRVLSHFRSKGFPIFKESVIAFYEGDKLNNSIVLTMYSCYQGSNKEPLSLKSLASSEVKGGWTQNYLKGFQENKKSFEINHLPSKDAGESLIGLAVSMVKSIYDYSFWELNEFSTEYALSSLCRGRSYVIKLSAQGVLSESIIGKVFPVVVSDSKKQDIAQNSPIEESTGDPINQDIVHDIQNVHALIKRQCSLFDDKDTLSLDDIPDHIVSVVRRHYGIPDSEEIYLVIDNTIRVNYENGVALTTSGLYWKNGWVQKTHLTYISWNKFLSSNITRDSDAIHLFEGAVIGLSTSNASSRKFAELLGNIQASLKSLTLTGGLDALENISTRVITNADNINDMVLECSSRREIRCLFIGQDIPEKKLNNAVIEYQIPQESDVLVLSLLDSTVFGSAKEGMAFCSSGIYWKNKHKRDQNGPFFISWVDFKSCEIHSEGADIYIGGKIFFTLEKVTTIVSFLNEIKEGVATVS
jgi:hypothetical protein